ncbi:MAG TPA: radical SAM family heme chaperone HemW [Oscillospiraceae bacterium]|nr:radical SAM family heme chaperone HemW [Oscillospiraceae bacterium]
MNFSSPMELYIHIPFCVKKCSYCDFYSFSAAEDSFQNYTNRICGAVEHYLRRAARPISSVYFGGGTPTLLGARRLIQILETAKACAPFLPEAEITAETNPGVEADFAELRRAGFNRLSIGLQSAEQNELTALGRIHTAAEAEETFRRAREADFDNISLDIMLGIPYQTEESLLRTLAFCKRLSPEHLSAYLLKIEEGTPLASSPLRERCADPDTAAALYETAAEKLAEFGYQRYEISNFAKPGFASKHNLGYWLGTDYLGLGPSAHSLMEGRRFYFGRSYRDFMEKDFPEAEIEEDAGGAPVGGDSSSDIPVGGWEEFAMLRLRLERGLSLTELSERFPEAPAGEIGKRAASLAAHGLCVCEDGIVRLTTKGFLLSNPVTAELLYGSPEETGA